MTFDWKNGGEQLQKLLRKSWYSVRLYEALWSLYGYEQQGNKRVAAGEPQYAGRYPF